LALLFAFNLGFGLCATAADSLPSPREIREAYERRQRSLTRTERRQALELVRQEAKRTQARTLPLPIKVILMGVGLVVLGSIADRHRWLPALLGNSLCQRMGYAFLLRGQRYWPRLRHLRVEQVRAPERIPLLQNIFIDPDKIDADDEERLVIDPDAVANYSARELGLDADINAKLRPTSCPFPVGRETFSEAA